MADIKLVYGTPAAVSMTLAGLATSADLLTGRQSAEVDNGTARALDYEVSGKITLGTSPTTAKEIEVRVVGLMDDTPTWPDAFAGADAGRVFSTLGTKDAASMLVARIATVATSDQGYWFGVRSLAALFGGVLPKKFAFWVAHNTGVNLHATVGNHFLIVRPVREDVA